MPVAGLPPRSIGTRSGSRWSMAASTLWRDDIPMDCRPPLFSRSCPGNVTQAKGGVQWLAKVVVERHPGSSATVHDQGLADDVARVLRGQEDGRPSDIPGHPYEAGRDEWT